MKKISLLVLVMGLMLMGCEAKKDEAMKTIGIIQIVEHTALDAAREGFIEGLKEAGFEDGKNIKIEYKNASGDGAVLNTIAQSFATNKKDLVFAIATPSAQAMTTASQELPIVFTAVTDPVAAKLVESLEKPGGNATGTIDAVDIEKQFELIKAFMPDTKTIGIIYNTSEVNSQIQVEEAKKAAAKFGFKIIEKGVTSTTEIDVAANSMLNDIDVMYLPTDNLVASSIANLSAIALKENVPVFAAEPGPVLEGAFASDGIDYFELGRQSAKMAVSILEGKAPSDLPIESQTQTSITVNETVLKQLGLNVPDQLKEKVTFVK